MSVKEAHATDQDVWISLAGPGDYATLLKPRVMSLVMLTALTGWLMAGSNTHPILAIISLLAIAMGAGASGALNMWYDADIDLKMSRTSLRPIPSGKILPGEALIFGCFLSVLSVTILAFSANWLAAGLLAFTIFFYAVIYTMWLKRWTVQNIVIGGAAGALPPVVAYAAASGRIGFVSILLFLIIFFWTPPHFWALSLIKKEEYGKAQIPMMPNVKGDRRTRLEILVYSCILLPLGITPWIFGYASPIYAILAVGLGLGMCVRAWQLWRAPESNIIRACWDLFKLSIFYLFGLFLELAVERLLGMPMHLSFP